MVSLLYTASNLADWNSRFVQSLTSNCTFKRTSQKKCLNRVHDQGYNRPSICSLIKTRLRITANVITDQGTGWVPKALLNFHQIVGVEEYFFRNVPTAESSLCHESSSLNMWLNFSTTATLGTDESGHCREVAAVERLKQESV